LIKKNRFGLLSCKYKLFKPETYISLIGRHVHKNVIIYSKVGWELLINNSW